MSTLTTYTELQAAVLEYLARDQDTTLTARIPTFIQLAEAKFNRDLFHPLMEQRSTTTFDTTLTSPEFIDLPSDFQTMRRVRLSSATGKPRVEFLNSASMDDYRFSIADATGKPIYFSIMGSEIEFAPTPDQNYTVEMVYRKKIPALASNSSNWLLTLAPDAYLYGALLESAPYIKEDERIQVWALGLKTALDSLNSHGQQQAFNAGPLRMRVSGVTP